MQNSKFFPESISYLQQPYLKSVDDEVVIAEISCNPLNGYKGLKQLYTALIPLAELDRVLKSDGGIGYQVRFWGPNPIVNPYDVFDGGFWVDGIEGSGKEYETIINSWWHGDRCVLLPDNGLLGCYGLIPRHIKENTHWDDLSKPIYSVLKVKSLYDAENDCEPLAKISIKRDYLEDYLHLKKCAAVAVFYEERYSSNDKEFDQVLGDTRGLQLTYPGFKIALIRDEGKFSQFTRVWGCSLILKPKERPITEEQDPSLIWPDYPHAISPQEILHNYDCPLTGIIVKDNVLQKFEDQTEYIINPKSGEIDYGSQWATYRCCRVGRHYISVPLNMLYKGTPAYIIRHFHQFAVSKQELQKDKNIYGNRHIGQRAEDVIFSFRDLCLCLKKLSNRLYLPIWEEEICGFEAAYFSNWWTKEEFKVLGNVIAADITYSEFTTRCKNLYQIFEYLKVASLKNILKKLNMPKKQFNSYGSLKLLGTVTQLSKIAKDNGDNLIDDFDNIISHWDKDLKLNELAPIFALNGLRNLDAHIGSEESKNDRLNEALKSYSIDPLSTKEGWGYALDNVYDRLAESLKQVTKIIYDGFLEN